MEITSVPFVEHTGIRYGASGTLERADSQYL